MHTIISIAFFADMTIKVSWNHAFPLCFQHFLTQFIIESFLFFSATTTMGSIYRQKGNYFVSNCNFHYYHPCIYLPDQVTARSTASQIARFALTSFNGIFFNKNNDLLAIKPQRRLILH
ncbi:unnamed protein product [Clavelina lepadiformis]|uniref:Uncharacterized protein n=1 Tax=Clavelina lepadiformis TaxID=159417 RepID=A0ABP0GB76_CLALP